MSGLCRSRGMAVLWATHPIEEAQVADRPVLLHQAWSDLTDRLRRL
ncbi:MAG: hypothetical protein R3E42_09585 [Burkholderiaceae bacterium]